MTEQAWNAGFARALMVRLSGEALGELDESGNPITDSTYVLLLNAADELIPFRLPPTDANQIWRLVFDTANGDLPRLAARRVLRYPLSGRAMALFQLEREPLGARGRRPARREADVLRE
jgi:glycogen operon protein